MATAIDVLAVLDAEIQRAGGEAYQAGRDLIEARAAVAELIEAARELADSQSRHWERGNAYISAGGARGMNAARDRVRAALARVGGGK